MRNFVLSVAVVALLAGSAFATPIVIDNGDAGYSETGGDLLSPGWANSVSSILTPKFNGDVSYTQKIGDTAIWSFSG